MSEREKRESNRWISAAILLLLCLVLLVGLPSRDFGGTQGFVYPLMGPRMSSDFGTRVHPKRKAVRHHNGIDLAAPAGAPIRAIAAGRVVFADPYAGYGNLVVIEHARGLTSHYGHCQEIIAPIGTQVVAGQIIAKVGSTGLSTGPHLHFEVRKNGEPYDPENVIPGLAVPGEG